MKKETKILIALLVIAFLVRILFTFSTPLRWWDETVYANLGYDLSRNPFDYSFANNGWSDWIPDGNYPKAGFRPPLLPYTLSLLYLLKLDFLILFLMPIIGTLSVFFIYKLGKKLFNSKVGIYSALFLCFSVVHSRFSGKILTDVFATFFIILSFLFFYSGYEENKKNYKILFAVFLALSVLAKYNMIWFIPIFFLYLLIKNKSLGFLKDKYLWISLLAFLLILSPLFIYSHFEYGNFLGAFKHAQSAASFWGGCQPWYFYFQNWFIIFGIGSIVFLISLIYIFYKKEYKKKEIYFLLFSIFIFLLLMITMCHKEDRHLLPIFPFVFLISSFFIEKLSKYKKIILSVLILAMVGILSYGLYSDYKGNFAERDLCFIQGNSFLKNIEEKSLIMTDSSPIVYYYTHKETGYYPNPFSLERLNQISETHNSSKMYLLFSNYDMPLDSKRNVEIKEELDKNFKTIFECKNITFVYE